MKVLEMPYSDKELVTRELRPALPTTKVMRP